MQIIDTRTGLGYKIIKFPDGESHLVLTNIDRKDSVIITCRIRNGEELFLMMQLSDVLKRQEVTVERLNILYLMGARMDRVVNFSEPYTLKIVADVINSFNARDVQILEPHSFKSLILIKNSHEWSFNHNTKDYTICFPDAGAKKRYSHRRDCIICSKIRDTSTGNLTGFKVENPQCFEGGNIMVVDDLCDGGGTFMGLAPKIRELNPEKLTLSIVHAIQLSGIERVASVYDEVFITDSYRDWQNEILPKNVNVIRTIL